MCTSSAACVYVLLGKLPVSDWKVFVHVLQPFPLLLYWQFIWVRSGWSLVMSECVAHKIPLCSGAQCLKSNKLYLVSQVGWLYWIHLSICNWIYAIPLSFHHSPSAWKKKHAKKNSKQILFFSFIGGKKWSLNLKNVKHGFLNRNNKNPQAFK